MTLPLHEQAALTSLLTQPHRTYHNINHVNDCLTEMEGYFQTHPEDEKVRWKLTHAIWYHDAVYNPYLPGVNERQSAELFAGRHERYFGDLNDIEDVVRAIELTAHHLVTHDNLTLTQQLMLDIDLSGFGKPSNVYRRNTNNIRTEYYNTTDFDFIKNRISFLRALRKRNSLYYTPYFYNKYHDASMYGIDFEIQQLELDE